ncbi:hypothetical protein EDD18DRAFT_1367506 [Armillaria luteobubalina]|uniref:DUF6533 domain-containing protein n=1 Tax=Armillaria luteobubalina TaxID=153913 RepID=A0AA39NZD1_9AGAR|nr:hypothetical protein EDD18DRAFT_1367506 [Armillaria luteobubalina]
MLHDASIVPSSSYFSDKNADITWSLIFWDYLITLDDEITLFWFSRRSWIKFLFFVNRYMGLLLRIWDIICEILKGADELFFDHLCGKVMSEGAYEVCSGGIQPNSILYFSMQIFVIESILVLRIWAIMGKLRWILWTFFGLLVCSTTISIVLSLHFFASIVLSEHSLMIMSTWRYAIPTLIFEAIIFASAAYHGVKASGGLRPLLLQSSVLYFIAVLCSYPIMVFIDPRLGIAIMSVTVNHMLLSLRKQVLSDAVGPPSQGVELTTLRFTKNEALSLEEGESVINIGSFTQES